MTKFIAITNSKGGVGKTITSIYLATLLSEHGSVLLKDSDPQGSATEWVEDIENLPFDYEITNQRQMGRGKGYDFVIIDTPPQNTEIMNSAIAVADLIIIPVQPSAIELSRVYPILDSSPEKLKKRVLITGAETNTNSLKYTIAIFEEEGIPFYKTNIRQRQAINNSFGTIPSTDLQLQDYRKALKEIIGDLNE